MAGVFIVFEGIDGSGKTTLCEMVRKELEKIGLTVEKTQEPTYDIVGRMIRENVIPGISQKAEALLFTADRAIHTEHMAKRISEGAIVICDRYFASTVAYQSASVKGESLDKNWLIDINLPVIMAPDITFLLDIDVDKSMKRVNKRGETSKFENIGYQRNVRQNYLDLAKQFGFVIVDADRTPEEVLEVVMKSIKETI
jgi:dTMP kinase